MTAQSRRSLSIWTLRGFALAALAILPSAAWVSRHAAGWKLAHEARPDAVLITAHKAFVHQPEENEASEGMRKKEGPRPAVPFIRPSAVSALTASAEGLRVEV